MAGVGKFRNGLPLAWQYSSPVLCSMFVFFPIFLILRRSKRNKFQTWINRIIEDKHLIQHNLILIVCVRITGEYHSFPEEVAGKGGNTSNEQKHREKVSPLLILTKLTIFFTNSPSFQLAIAMACESGSGSRDARHPSSVVPCGYRDRNGKWI